MFGSIRSLKPGQQGGGLAPKKPRSSLKSSDGVGPAAKPILRQSSRPVSALEEAVRQERAKEEAEKRGKRERQHLPEWITVGNRVGYLSSAGHVCEGFIESISLEKSEVKFVFAEDERIWKRIQFSTIVSKMNPLRRLAVKGDRTKNMTEMLNAAQQMEIDKSIMLTRILGEGAANVIPGPRADSDAGNSNSAAPEAGSEPGSACSRSRSRSPRHVGAEAGGEGVNPQVPGWIVVGKRAHYISKSGSHREVDIDSISATEVKIVFVDDRECWKGIPFSMLNSRRSPLKPIEEQAQPSGDAIVDLDSDGSNDGSMNSGVEEVSPKKQAVKLPEQLPEWIAVGQKVGYVSKSSGKLCAVEVESISDCVKIVFVDNREVWKGIPFSLALSDQNPLRRL